MATNKKKTKEKRISKFREKIEMYDYLLASMLAGNSVIEPEEHLNGDEIEIGFSNICSDDMLTKYFLIRQLPLFIDEELFRSIRARCSNPGVRINFYTIAKPHMINWESSEMKNRMYVWENFSKNTADEVSIFKYRANRGKMLLKDSITLSTKYLNMADLDQSRRMFMTYMYVVISAPRDEESIMNMVDSIESFKGYCSANQIKLREIKINMIDWLKALDIFSMKYIKGVTDKISRRIMTDDNIALLGSYKQGAVGDKGIPLAMDVQSMMAIMYNFKEIPDNPENWLIGAETGSGKSYFIKPIIINLLATGKFRGFITDYEGDEYLYLGDFIRAGSVDDVKVFALGVETGNYFEACEIGELTGVEDVDKGLKATSQDFIEAEYRILIKGTDGELTSDEKAVLSLGISMMYEEAGVTEDRSTWKNSKGLRIDNPYRQIKYLVEKRALVDSESGNRLHSVAASIVDSCSIFFEETGSKYGTFRNPISISEIYKAKLSIISFGMKGADKSLEDPVVLALKQLCIAYVSIQISNYCKYVLHCFNFKVWEEFQRWGSAKGSSDIIINTITGGRKRGDVNFIITNDLNAFLDDGNKVTSSLVGNIQNYAIGKIKDLDVRKKLCAKFELEDCLPAINKIAKASKRKKKSRSSMRGSETSARTKDMYDKAFCFLFDNGERAIGKVMLPDAIANSKLLRTSVDINRERE